MVKNKSNARREEMPDSPKSSEGLNTPVEAINLPDEAINPPEHETEEMLARARRWRTIWIQVIALAWRDPAFKAALIKDARCAIFDKFQYELSPELELTIECAQTGTYDPNIPLTKDRWTGLPKMKLKMFLPPPPPADHQAVAVTHYSETGRTYPMTSG
jgi:ribosomally synthesized peptide (two-chain TOMM family)